MANKALLTIPLEAVLEYLNVDGLPDDVTVYAAAYEIASNSIVICLESAEFQVTDPGMRAPFLQLICKRTYKFTVAKET